MKKLWCRHITWSDLTQGWLLQFIPTHPFWLVPDDWDICPFKGCRAERPIGKHKHHFMSFKTDATEVCIFCGLKRAKRPTKRRGEVND